MKSKLALVLLLGGAAIGGITWWGYSTVSKPSDVEILQQAIFEQQERERQQAATAAELSAQVLTAPESCAGLTTAFIYAICETEPDPGADWPDWTNIATPAEQGCMIDAVEKTNAHAHAIQNVEHTPTEPTPNRMGNFISDVCTASLFTDGVDWGDTDAPASRLINGFFADRATSIFAPGQDY